MTPTLKELYQLQWLSAEIEMDRRRLSSIEERVQPKAQILTGMPHANDICDKVGECVAEIADLRDIIADKYQRCIRERIRLEQYIASIDDSLLRQIFTYRFVYGLTWRQVSARIGGGNSEDGCRMMVTRYLSGR